MFEFILSAMVLGGGWVFWRALNAPEGYEDNTGFHYGPEHSDYDGE